MANLIEIIIGAKDNASPVVKQVHNSFNGLTKDAKKTTDDISKSFGSLKNAILGAAAALGLVKLGNFMIDTVAGFEQLEVALTSMMKSSAKAKEAMDWISEFTAKTPYELTEVGNAFKKLFAQGFDPKQLLQPLGDAAGAMGKTLDQAVEMFTDAVRGETERLKEFGVTASQAADKVTYHWNEKGREQVMTVRKNSTEMTQAILTIFERFKGGMDAQSRTWKGMVSNLSDAWSLFIRDIMESGPFQKLKENLDDILKKIDDWRKSGRLNAWAADVGASITRLTRAFGLLGSAPEETLTKIKGAFKAILDTTSGVAEAVTPILKTLASGIGRLVDIYNGLPDFMKGAAGIGLLAAVLLGGSPAQTIASLLAAAAAAAAAAEVAGKYVGDKYKENLEEGKKWAEWFLPDALNVRKNKPSTALSRPIPKPQTEKTWFQEEWGALSDEEKKKLEEEIKELKKQHADIFAYDAAWTDGINKIAAYEESKIQETGEAREKMLKESVTAHDVYRKKLREIDEAVEANKKSGGSLGISEAQAEILRAKAVADYEKGAREDLVRARVELDAAATEKELANIEKRKMALYEALKTGELDIKAFYGGAVQGAEELLRAGDREIGKIKEKTAAQEAFNQKYGAYIDQAAKKYNLDANLLRGQIWQESRGNPNAVGTSGERGLMQIMKGTASDLQLAWDEAFDPYKSIDAGARYLKAQLDRFGDIKLALTAYNRGPGNAYKDNGYADLVLAYKDQFAGVAQVETDLAQKRKVSAQELHGLILANIQEEAAAKARQLELEQAKNNELLQMQLKKADLTDLEKEAITKETEARNAAIDAQKRQIENAATAATNSLRQQSAAMSREIVDAQVRALQDMLAQDGLSVEQRKTLYDEYLLRRIEQIRLEAEEIARKSKGTVDTARWEAAEIEKAKKQAAIDPVMNAATLAQVRYEYAQLAGSMQEQLEAQKRLVLATAERNANEAKLGDIAEMYRQIGKEQARLIEVWKTGSFAEGFVEGLKEIGRQMETVAQLGRKFALDLKSNLSDFFNDVMTRSKSLGDALTSFWQNIQKSISKLASDQMASVLLGGLGELFGGKKSEAGGLGGLLKGLAGDKSVATMNVTASVVNLNGSGITGVAGQAGNIAEQASGGGEFVDKAKGWFSGLFESVKGAFSKIFESLKSIFSGIFGALQDALGSIFSGLGNVLGSLGSGIGGLFSGFSGLFPAFEAGGNPPLDRLVLVGEKGPELVKFRSPATIYPNGSEVSVAGPAAESGVTHFHFHISAMDSKSLEDFVRRNKSIFTEPVLDSIRRRGPVRTAIRGAF